eukprot:154504-Chlamydomonas_euryale.AAC.5
MCFERAIRYQGAPHILDQWASALPCALSTAATLWPGVRRCSPCSAPVEPFCALVSCATPTPKSGFNPIPKSGIPLALKLGVTLAPRLGITLAPCRAVLHWPRRAADALHTLHSLHSPTHATVQQLLPGPHAPRSEDSNFLCGGRYFLCGGRYLAGLTWLRSSHMPSMRLHSEPNGPVNATGAPVLCVLPMEDCVLARCMLPSSTA